VLVLPVELLQRGDRLAQPLPGLVRLLEAVLRQGEDRAGLASYRQISSSSTAWRSVRRRQEIVQGRPLPALPGRLETALRRSSEGRARDGCGADINNDSRVQVRRRTGGRAVVSSPRRSSPAGIGAARREGCQGPVGPRCGGAARRATPWRTGPLQGGERLAYPNARESAALSGMVTVPVAFTVIPPFQAVGDGSRSGGKGRSRCLSPPGLRFAGRGSRNVNIRPPLCAVQNPRDLRGAHSRRRIFTSERTLPP
jgi:hypothetical protein